MGFSLIGNMVMKKPANLDAMKSVLSKVWKLIEDVGIQEVGGRTWISSFVCIGIN